MGTAGTVQLRVVDQSEGSRSASFLKTSAYDSSLTFCGFSLRDSLYTANAGTIEPSQFLGDSIVLVNV